jgi:uncharacterized protein YbbC (DUF1343 family)
MLRPGISVLLDERRDLLDGRRVAVLTNASGVLPELTGTADALLAAADLRAIFCPEHGLRGAALHGEEVAGGMDRSGVPLYSLYGANFAPTSEQLADLDLIVCDLQDVGCRFYTYVWTVIKLIEAAAQAGVAVLIADRPNPIGGGIEGPGVEPEQRTLVGLYDVPVRHGLTIGELALLINREAGFGCDLTVLPCDGWRRSLLWRETGLPWVPPSPNMPTAEAALIYPGTCLGEGINISVGRGSAKPFEWLGAPWIDAVKLADALNDLELPGLRWRPLAFQPCAEPYSGELCEGVQPHVIDPAALRPVAAGVALIAMIAHLYPNDLRWTKTHFDRLAGSPRLRESLLQMEPRRVALAALTDSWQAFEDAFRDRSAPVLLYR